MLSYDPLPFFASSTMAGHWCVFMQLIMPGQVQSFLIACNELYSIFSDYHLQFVQG